MSKAIKEKLSPASFYIRWMIKSDLPRVLEIDSGYEHPLSEEEYISISRRRNCIGMTAEYGDKVVGFMVYELHKDRLDVLRLAVDKELHGCGIGSALVEKLISKLSIDRRSEIVFHVRESNLNAQRFLKRRQFVASVEREYFDDGADAYKFVYTYGKVGR